MANDVLRHVESCEVCKAEILTCAICKNQVVNIESARNYAVWRCNDCRQNIHVRKAPDLQHIETWRQADSGAEMCDFCGQRPAIWGYGCEDFTFQGWILSPQGLEPAFKDQDKVQRASRGGWAACVGCHSDIEADDWESVARRAVQTIILPKVPPEKRTARVLGMAVEDMIAWHKGFRENRTDDPPLPVAEWPE